MKKRENILMGVGIILLVVAIVGVSYAAFSYTGAGSKLNTITTGVISMSYTESDNVISMDKALPTTDDTGKVRLRDGEYFDFTIESTIEGNAIINYEVAAEALSSNTFDGKNVKLYLTRINGTTEEEIMLPKLYIPRTTENTKTGRPEGMLNLVTGSMGASETIKYRLRMYVKEGYNPQDDNGDEVFQVKINVYGKVAEEVTGTLIEPSNAIIESRASVDDNNYAVPMTAEYLASAVDFHDSEYASKTTAIITKDNSTIPATALASWDISVAKDGKAVAYYEENGLMDESGNPLYTLILGGEGGLLANTNMSDYFSDFYSIETMDLTYLDTSIVTDMSYMFFGCERLESLDLSSFDTSNVTNLKSMFYSCSSLTTLDLSKFDTSKVENMSFLFRYCEGLSTFNLNSFDTSSVTMMDQMFYGCSITTLDLSNFDTSNVASMGGMFSNCSGTTLDLSSFDTSNVSDMSYMFFQCTTLTSLDLSSFDTSIVTDMSYMFYSCSNLITLDLSNFDTLNVSNMDSMFRGCSSLTSLNISSFDTSNVTDMQSMFYGCIALTSLDLSSFDTSKVTRMRWMFQNSTKLTLIRVSSKWVIGADTDATNMFSGCGTDHVTCVNCSNEPA